MRVKLFTFRYSATLGGFDETPLASFLKDKEVLAFREHFFHVNDTPHLVCVVTWQDAVVGETELETARALRAKARDDETDVAPGPTERRRTRSRGAAPDPTAGLDERERTLFNSLREWRAAVSSVFEHLRHGSTLGLRRRLCTELDARAPPGA